MVALGDQIQHLEQTLLQADVRKSPEKLKELLSDDFLEYASTGEIYDKDHVLNRLPQEEDPQIVMKNFQCRSLSRTSVLTTFHIHVKKRGTYSLRSSVWKLNDGKWQMTFHQGTPTKMEI